MRPATKTLPCVREAGILRTNSAQRPLGRLAAEPLAFSHLPRLTKGMGPAMLVQRQRKFLFFRRSYLSRRLQPALLRSEMMEVHHACVFASASGGSCSGLLCCQRAAIAGPGFQRSEG